MSGPGQALRASAPRWAEVLAAMLGVRAPATALAGFRLAVMRGAGPAAMLGADGLGHRRRWAGRGEEGSSWPR